MDKLCNKDIEMLNLPGQSKDAVLQEAGQKVFRSAVGALAWLSGITRPDLARAQTELASRQGKARVEDAAKAYKLIKKVAAVPQSIAFTDLGSIEDVLVSPLSPSPPSPPSASSHHCQHCHHRHQVPAVGFKVCP